MPRRPLGAPRNPYELLGALPRAPESSKWPLGTPSGPYGPLGTAIPLAIPMATPMAIPMAIPLAIPMGLPQPPSYHLFLWLFP